jgi:hypothetical protein
VARCDARADEARADGHGHDRAAGEERGGHGAVRCAACGVRPRGVTR